MSMNVHRSGATLAELAVALVLAGIAAALGAGMLVAAERRARRDAQISSSAQTTREVLHTLGTEIASARWGSIVVRGDTALDLQSHVGASVACVVSGNVIILPPARSSVSDSWTAWRYPPEAADRVAVWDTTGAWSAATIDSVTTSSGGGCAAGGPFRTLADSLAGEPLTRIRLSVAIPAASGAPIRVFRDTRWMFYRGGDNKWWLGQRRCGLPGCGSAQPASGPLAAPADSGLRFELSPDDRVRVRVRALSNGARAAVVSQSFTVRGAPHAVP